MGEDFRENQTNISEADFLKKVEKETSLLELWFEQRKFETGRKRFGFELEGWLVDQDGLPAPENAHYIDIFKDPNVVPELSQFNFEINSRIHDVDHHLFENVLEELTTWEKRSWKTANQLQLSPVWIGILPTIRDPMLSLETMSPQNRYFELTKSLIDLRKGKPLRLHIDRKDIIDLERQDVMTEAATTSLQIHWQVDQDDAAKAYNVCQMISAPLVAICANSPFLFGKKLWDETRIPLFQQSLEIDSCHGSVDPVTFGEGFLDSSLFELFEENLEKHHCILPIRFQNHESKLRHLKFFNGQIWRWNRPIVGTGPKPSLRIEHRSIPAGPTSIDMTANMAFFAGLLNYFLSQDDLELSFSECRKNFYQCAKMGLKADVTWKQKTYNVQTLLHDHLLDHARIGLKKIGIQNEMIRFLMDEVMRNRIRTGWNGAAWQKSFIDIHGPDFQTMTLAYIDNQKRGEPVHKWKC